MSNQPELKKRFGGKVVRSERKNYREKPDTHNTWRRASESTSTDDIDESEQCIICADRVKFAAISACNHKTCHTCAFRQRALYEKNACLVCRTEHERFIITEDIHKNYGDIPASDLKCFNDKFGIDFTSAVAERATLSLLEMTCPLPYCKSYLEHEVFKNLKALNAHVKSEHDKHFCDICCSQKRSFISELKLYHSKELQQHKSKGDNDGFKGHPLCQFCTGRRFYSDDELFVHLRERHEKCHVCDQIDATNPQYFKDYEALSEHFRYEHYVCNIQSCLDQKFVVFRDEFDLKAHMIKEHKNLFGGDRNLLSLGNIGYSTPKRNGFGSQLSTVTPTPNNRNSNTVRPNRPPEGFRTEEEDDIDSQELKKMRLEERARHYLNYNAAKVEQFKELNRKFEAYKIEVDGLLQGYRELFGIARTEELEILLSEFAELFEMNSLRRKRLAEAARAMNSVNNMSAEERFPALPGQSAHSLSGGWATSSSKKDGMRNSNSQAFPALPKPSSPVVLDNSNVVSYNVRLSQPSSRSTTPVIKKNNNTTYDFKNSYLSPHKKPAAQTPTPKADDSKFPALPTKVIKKPPRVNPIRTDSGVWGQSSSSAATPDTHSSMDLSSLDNSINTIGSSSGGKKQKKKKQVLYHVGI